jgi:flagellin
MVDFNAIGSLGGSSGQQNIKRANDKLRAVVETLVSGNRINKAADDVAALSLASLLQAQTSGLKQVSSNVAQASSLTQVADGGIEQIQQSLEQLRSLAAQAKNPTLNPANREQLDKQFQQLVQDIDRIAGNTSFNNQKLLNGDLSGDNALSLNGVLGQDNATESTETLTLDDLSSSRLFNGQSLSVLTPQSADAAIAAIDSALRTAAGARAEVGSFQQSLNFVGASIDSAVINQEAARAILQDTDFAEASTQFSLADLQQKASIALAAQGNRLSPNLLKLIG